MSWRRLCSTNFLSFYEQLMIILYKLLKSIRCHISYNISFAKQWIRRMDCFLEDRKSENQISNIESEISINFEETLRYTTRANVPKCWWVHFGISEITREMQFYFLANEKYKIVRKWKKSMLSFSWKYKFEGGLSSGEKQVFGISVMSPTAQRNEDSR